MISRGTRPASAGSQPCRGGDQSTRTPHGSPALEHDADAAPTLPRIRQLGKPFTPRTLAASISQAAVPLQEALASLRDERIAQRPGRITLGPVMTPSPALPCMSSGHDGLSVFLQLVVQLAKQSLRAFKHVAERAWIVQGGLCLIGVGPASMRAGITDGFQLS